MTVLKIQRDSRKVSLAPSSTCVSPAKNPEIIQAGLSDVDRQMMQQKIKAEIQAKKEEHLTVYKKSSLDIEEAEEQDDEGERRESVNVSVIDIQVDEVNHVAAGRRAKALKALVRLYFYSSHVVLC